MLRLYITKINVLLLLILLSSIVASAATVTVTQIADDGTGATSGSLSWAINSVADGDKIAFNLSSGDVITLSAALPQIVNSLTIEGINIATGNPVTIQVSNPGVSAYRVFDFSTASKTFTLNDLIMRGGDISASNNDGGVIYCNPNATLKLNRCSVTDGKARYGGGIYSGSCYLDQCTVYNNMAINWGGGCYLKTLCHILNSTITGNTAQVKGGGIAVVYPGIVNLINSAVSGNSAVNGGGGIYVQYISFFAGTLLALNSIVINNTATTAPDILKEGGAIYTSIYVWSTNVANNTNGPSISTAYTTGDLGALADNGGPTQTMELSASAPAYHAGTNAYYNATDLYYYKGTDNNYYKLATGTSFTPSDPEADKITTDQRGATRDATPSMGAYGGELATTISSQPQNASKAIGQTATFSVTASNAIGYQWQVNTGSGFANLTDGGIYSGATTATLSISGVPLAMSGYKYKCIVSGSPSNLESSEATLTVFTPIFTDGTNQYATWSEAVLGTTEGGTITMLDNYTLSSDATLTKSLTLNLAGYTFSGTNATSICDGKSLALNNFEVNGTFSGVVSYSGTTSSLRIFKAGILGANFAVSANSTASGIIEIGNGTTSITYPLTIGEGRFNGKVSKVVVKSSATVNLSKPE